MFSHSSRGWKSKGRVAIWLGLGKISVSSCGREREKEEELSSVYSYKNDTHFGSNPYPYDFISP